MADVSNRKRVQKGIPAGGQFDAEKRPEMGATLDLGAGFAVATEGVNSDKLAKKSVEFRYASADMSHDGKTYTYAGLAPTTNPHGGPVVKPRDIPSVDAYLRSTGKTLRSLDTVHLYDEDGDAVWGVVERTSGDLIGTSDEVRFDDPDSRYRNMDPQQAAITKACEELGNDSIYQPNAAKLLRLGYNADDTESLEAGLYAGADRTDSREISPYRARLVQQYGKGRIADLNDPDIENALLNGDGPEVESVLSNTNLTESSRRHDLIATVDPDRAHRYDRGHSAGLSDDDLAGTEDVDTMIALSKRRSSVASSDVRRFASEGHTPETFRRYGDTACELFPAHVLEESGASDSAIRIYAGVVPLNQADDYLKADLEPGFAAQFHEEISEDLSETQQRQVIQTYAQRWATRDRSIRQAWSFGEGERATPRQRALFEAEQREWQRKRLDEIVAQVRG